MPLTVIKERPNRILTLLKLISIAFDMGRLTWVPISLLADAAGCC
jgi:hypothetical protein